jgi:hypothetical protein
VNGLSSTSTQLVRDRAYWTQVIHNAAKVTPDDPRYAASRLVAQQAIQGLHDWADTAADKDVQAYAPGRTMTAVTSFAQGASLGLASKLGDLLPGAPNSQYLELARQTNPKSAIAGDLVGTAALGGLAAPLVAGLSPAVGGAVLGGALGGARGAIEPIPGLSRTESAAVAGTAGAVSGAVLGKVVAKLTPAIRTVVANAKRLLGPGIAPADAEALTEAAVRSKLAEYNLAPDVLERAVQSWKAKGELSVRGAPPAKPVATRPGETLTPILPKLRAAADPLETQPAYARAGNPYGLPTPKGPSVGPAPVPAAPPDPMAAFVESLRPPSAAPGTINPYSQQAAARSAYHLADAAGLNATEAARRAAGTYSTYDPRQALALALLLRGLLPQQSPPQ